MKKKPKQLEFISQIKGDGSGTVPVTDKTLKFMLENPLQNNEKLKLTSLSLSNKTYIASGFNSFVVRLKK